MGLDMAIASTCGVIQVTKMLCHGGHNGSYRCRGLPISSSHVPECSSHVEYKWVKASVSMPHGKILSWKMIILYRSRELSMVIKCSLEQCFNVL